MERSFSCQRSWIVASLLAMVVVSTSGCVSSILATGIYLWQGGNVVPAQCELLEDQRVVVVCRPPSSNEYRHAGAARSIGKRVSKMLEINKVPGIDVVSPSEVDNWVDEQDWDNFKDLGRAVKASRIVYIELDNFDLFKGATLYQGNAKVQVKVYDMDDRGREVWERNVGQILFPRNSGIPSADKSVQEFQRQFIEVVSTQIAQYFYKHDPNAAFALDAIANK
ncbi:MAG: hypothetical protein GXP26_00600 [Planctomycetes bacterium]|nr:hypothetical protein [Planctomycetota bacterium]